MGCAALDGLGTVGVGLVELTVRGPDLAPRRPNQYALYLEDPGAWPARAGVPCVDVLPAMEVDPAPGSLHGPEDRHPSAAGHAVVAERIAEALPTDGLVP